jgi:hypothetical protein
MAINKLNADKEKPSMAARRRGTFE